ncbi:UNKNOWN [Stylonychia lemnae]|uniref:Uncharacterized protein n=1 Tax=Stylonychia lemnae TaxID=5949 RepID=A0A078AGQ0_STYLE|nr:UNKNOWN [Stylonychia lemnae]|eukprot:CDW81016.1 UNKNOWN [Stylonychia lemnae]
MVPLRIRADTTNQTISNYNNQTSQNLTKDCSLSIQNYLHRKSTSKFIGKTKSFAALPNFSEQSQIAVSNSNDPKITFYKLYKQPTNIISSPVNAEIEKYQDLKQFQSSLQDIRKEKKQADNKIKKLEKSIKRYERQITELIENTVDIERNLPASGSSTALNIRESNKSREKLRTLQKEFSNDNIRQKKNKHFLKKLSNNENKQQQTLKIQQKDQQDQQKVEIRNQDLDINQINEQQKYSNKENQGTQMLVSQRRRKANVLSPRILNKQSVILQDRIASLEKQKFNALKTNMERSIKTVKDGEVRMKATANLVNLDLVSNQDLHWFYEYEKSQSQLESKRKRSISNQKQQSKDIWNIIEFMKKQSPKISNTNHEIVDYKTRSSTILAESQTHVNLLNQSNLNTTKSVYQVLTRNQLDRLRNLRRENGMKRMRSMGESQFNDTFRNSQLSKYL